MRKKLTSILVLCIMALHYRYQHPRQHRKEFSHGYKNVEDVGK